jgi:L-arabinose transport system permease protein
MVGLSLSVATLGMVACTMTFALASGNFDLSVGSIVAFSGVAAAVVINVTGSTVLGILAGLAGSMLIGFVNGTVIAKLKINALITTLAMMQIVRGLAFIVSGGSAVGIRNANFYVLGTGTLAGIPMPIWIVLGYFLLFAGVLNKTTYGRNTLAIGGNEEAVRLSGINVDRIKIAIFSIQGLMTGFAGIVLAARMTSGQPNTSQGFELTVISACVLGGVSLSGGVASMTGALVGVLIMGSVQNAMNLLNVPTFYQYVARGTILLAAVIFDTLKQGRAR